METEDQNKKKRGGMIWIILLIASLLLNLYQWKSHTTIVNTMEQQVSNLASADDSVKQVLTSTRTELEQYRGKSAQLDSLLDQAKRDLDEKEVKLKNLTGKERNMEKLNAELKSQLKDLQGLRDEYLAKVDSLLTSNKQLTVDKQQLSGKVETLSKNLETTVNKASLLQAEYIKVTTYKRSGNGKYKENPNAKRIHKMQVCFDLLENKITKPGDKNIYLKITEPGGKPLGDRSKGSGDMKMVGSDEMVMYASTTTINYANAKQNVCLSWEEQKDKMFTPGKYLIEIYVDGSLAGASSHTMK